MRASPPLAMERLRDYRIRLLRGMKKHSKQFSHSDLDTIADPSVFNSVEQSIYADSILASVAPDSVPRGQLRMVTKRLPSGHLENTFIGQPQAWMDIFAGSRRYVVSINPKYKE
jgi:colicin import membrane protein